MRVKTILLSAFDPFRCALFPSLSIIKLHKSVGAPVTYHSGKNPVDRACARGIVDDVALAGYAVVWFAIFR